MADLPRIAGVVLAGGQSRRMGRNKALLDFQGKLLIRHMLDKLHALGLTDVFISGALDGYPSIPDDHPHAGPARGIKTVLREKPGYDGYLFVPVDMPLLPAPALRLLLEQEGGGYFIGWPLPACLRPPFSPCDGESVHAFLKAQGIYPLPVPEEFEESMKNINTPQDWERLTGTS